MKVSIKIPICIWPFVSMFMNINTCMGTYTLPPHTLLLYQLPDEGPSLQRLQMSKFFFYFSGTRVRFLPIVAFFATSLG